VELDKMHTYIGQKTMEFGWIFGKKQSDE
jgi:hypothetical protein